MSETINFKTGWLKDPEDNQKFAPKTTTNQVLTSDGNRLTDDLTKLSNTLDGVKEVLSNLSNSIPDTYETKTDATSKYNELNTKVEKATPFTATYNQTTYNEIKAAYDSGRPIQVYNRWDNSYNLYNELVKSTDTEFVFRAKEDNGEVEYVCSAGGWSTRNIQVMKLGNAIITYDAENERLVFSFK